MYLRTLLNSGQRYLPRSVGDASKLWQLGHRTQKLGIVLQRHASQQQFPHASLFRREFSTTASRLDMPEGRVQSPTEHQKVSVSGDDVPEPCHSFHDSDLEEYILLELKKLGLTQPTTIQSYCLPVVLSGRDMVGIGQTGSGKTLAYILPALVHVRQNAGQRKSGPSVLILAPTRELAQQIQEVVKQFSHICRITSACLYGGVSKGPQIQSLRNGVDICIATPGRLIDLNEMGVVNLSDVSYLVFDEADRMLDMGFEPQVRKIAECITSSHQTLMWSATWPPEVRDLARDFLSNDVQVKVGSTELMANPNITQHVHVCNPFEKDDRLSNLLKEILDDRRNKVLIFAQMKRQVDQLTRSLVWNKISATCIHGDKTQLQRDKALYEFKKNNTRVLIATDIAARGLDITDITHIINYNFPGTVETYVHRIGRTARAEKTGTAHTFLTPEEGPYANDLIEILSKCNQFITPELMDLAQQFPSRKKQSSSFQFRGEYHNNRGSQRQNAYSHDRPPQHRDRYNRCENSFFDNSGYQRKNRFGDNHFDRNSYSSRGNTNMNRSRHRDTDDSD